MDPEEFLAYIDSLPPSVQQSMMQYVLAGGDPSMGGTAPFGAGPMNTGRLGGQFQGPLGVSPYDPMSVGAAYAYTPQLDTRGREQPFDLGTAQQNLNYIQDAQGNLFNNAMMMQGGEGVYAPGTFDPLPGQYDMLLQGYRAQGPTTYQGFIADLVASGFTPDQALNEFWATADDPEDPNSAALLASLPTKYVEVSSPTGAVTQQAIEGGDREAVQRLAWSLAEAQMTQGQPQYGEVAQDFINKGIPFPTERYGEGSYSMESQFPTTWGGGGMSAITEAQRRLEEARAGAQPEAIQRAQAKYLTGVREESARPIPPARSATSGYPGEARIGYGENINPNNLPLSGAGTVILPESSGSAPAGNPNNYPLARTAGIVAQPAPLPLDMEPTTTGRSANRVAAGMGRSATNAYTNAQRELEAAQRAVYTPEARRAQTRNRAMNQLGRTPTQDTLMARQLVNYMMGAYGPRG